VTVFENCWVEIGIQVVFNFAGHRLIAQFCYVLTELVAASVVTDLCQATRLSHPPPPTVHSVPLQRSKAVCKVCHIPRDSRLSLLTLLSAYCLTILMHCGWRCRQRLYATARDSEFCPPCIASAKVLTFFFVFTAILVPKKMNENADVFFGRKIKKCVFWRRKIKRKRNSVGL